MPSFTPGASQNLQHPHQNSHPPPLPRPPAALPHNRLGEPANGAFVTVAGLVMVRQRPGTAKGVIFLTLEDETGIANVVVWTKIYEKYRRAVVAGRLLRVHGQLQREGEVAHIIAKKIDDLSPLLDHLVTGEL